MQIAMTLALACIPPAAFSTEAPSREQIKRGQRLLAHYQCGACHAIPGVQAARSLTGPSLQAFGKRSYIAGHLANTREQLARWIVNPSSLVPETTMPSLGVSIDDARAMAAYLHTLQ